MISAGVSKHPGNLSHGISDATRNNIGRGQRRRRELTVEFAVEGIERVHEVSRRRLDLGGVAATSCRRHRERCLAERLVIKTRMPPDALSRRQDREA